MRLSHNGDMRIVSVGGGPAGLYVALLAKRADPSREVVVLERNGPDDTFGFGVVFSEATLHSLRAHDAQTHDAIAGALVRWDEIEVRHGGRALRSAGHGFAAIERARLLQILQLRAAEVGVDLRFRTEATPAELAGCDLVIAADGVNSRTRAAAAAAFRPSTTVGAAKYVWFGTTKVFDSFCFLFRRGAHGAFSVHAYPYRDDRSTFIVETDEASWRAAGLDGFDAAGAPPGASDLAGRDYVAELFAEDLDGAELLVNNSRWLNFTTLRTGTWVWAPPGRPPVVLLGDAAHTAHFSVGSGTKMALEDAIALAAALDREPDAAAAVVAVAPRRRPGVEHIQRAAAPASPGGALRRDHGPAAGAVRVQLPDPQPAPDPGPDARPRPRAGRHRRALVRPGGPRPARGPPDRGRPHPAVPEGRPRPGRPRRPGARGGGRRVGRAGGRARGRAGGGHGRRRRRRRRAGARRRAAGGARRRGARRGRSGALVAVGVEVDGTAADEAALLAAVGGLDVDLVAVSAAPGIAEPDAWRHRHACERIRVDLARPTLMVGGIAGADEAATLVLAGRADLVAWEGGAP